MSDTKLINKEDWLGFLHQLHNKVRNSKGIKLTGIPALNEISNFLMFRFVEKYIDEEKLPKFCKFSYLYDKYAADEKINADKKVPDLIDKNSYKLWNTVYNVKNDNCVIKKLLSNDFFKKYLSSDVNRVSAYINRSAVCETVQEMFKMINSKFNNIELNYDFYDAFGAAYEQFKTDAVSNSGKRTGQHFTPVSIKQFIINELQPKPDDAFYEPCSGSGGFIHTAYSYIYKKYPKTHEKFKQNIYANECNPEIIKPLMINMLLHNIPVDNIHEQDSLDPINCNDYEEKFDLIVTNPPFGMRTELKDLEYWTPLKIGKTIIKESTNQFLVHILKSLKKGGRAGVVIDRGILNNGTDKSTTWQSKFRKYFVDSSNIYKIVYLPTGIFDYTNFATAIIFFKKDGKTKKIAYYEGKFDDENKKTGLIIDEKPLKIISYDEIVKNDYSLKIDTDNKSGEKFKVGWIKLDDIVEIKRGKFLKTEEMNGSKYQVIGGGFKPMNYYYDIANTEENEIIMSNDGAYAGYINKFNKKMFITSHCNKLQIKNEIIIKDYVYYFLKFNQIIILEAEEKGGYQKRQGTPSINIPKMLREILIPSLSFSHQKEIIGFLDKQFEKYDINQLSNQIKDVPLFNLLINRQYDYFSDALYLIYRKLETESLYEKYESDKKAVFHWMLNGMKYEMKKLSELIEYTKTGTTLPEDERYKIINNEYNIPYYGTGSITGYTDKYLFDGKYLLFSLDGSVGKINLIDGKFWCNHHVRCMQFKKITCIEYIYNFMNYLDYNDIIKCNSIPNITWCDLQNLLIKIPSLTDQQKIVKSVEEIQLEQSKFKQYICLLQNTINIMYETVRNTTLNDNKKLDINNNIDINLLLSDNIKSQMVKTNNEFEEINKYMKYTCDKENEITETESDHEKVPINNKKLSINNNDNYDYPLKIDDDNDKKTSSNYNNEEKSTIKKIDNKKILVKAKITKSAIKKYA